MDQNFTTFCMDAELSNDEPTRLCALFLKEMESYLRGIHGVRNQDFWGLEIEGTEWLGAYKICGKTNYVTETLHRMDTLYGDDMNDHDLEWLRMNKFFVLSEGGHAVTMDELNEFLNLWNKSCVGTSDFELFCARSKHIMALKKSSYATFGQRTNCPKR